MEGIKEAIAFITGLAVRAEDPKTVEINGKTYCTKDLVRYDAPEKAAPISATTLTSLVDYIKENREELRDFEYGREYDQESFLIKLVAADGGVWKSQAVANVKAYLVEALKDIPDRDKITIIA